MLPTVTDSRSRNMEVFGYRMLITSMSLAYFYFAFLAPSPSFGFNQLSHLGSPFLGALAASLPIVLLFMPERIWARISGCLIRLERSMERFAGSHPGRILIALAAFAAFFLSRNGFINGDGVNCITYTFPECGGSITFDEMLTSVSIYRLWIVLDGAFGISARDTFGIWSSAFGAASVWLILSASGILFRRNVIPFVVLFMCGGFTQLYFGDVEAYTAVSFFVLAYCLAAVNFLEGRWTLVVPAILFSLAMCFHLLVGWLAPTLLFLFILAARSGRWVHIFTSVLLMAFEIFASIVIVGLCGIYLWQARGLTHTAYAGTYLLALNQPSAYWGQMFNLLFLLFPSWGIIGLLAVFRRIVPDRVNIFLCLALGSLLLLAFC